MEKILLKRATAISFIVIGILPWVIASYNLMIFGMIFIIFGSCLLVYQFTNKNKEIKKENSNGATIISFLLPIIGFIIYAINVGKNDSLAKQCCKWAFLGLAFSVFVGLLYIYLLNNVI